MLVYFSFFYTDKVIDLINKKDFLMVEIVNLKDDYEIIPVDGIINGNTIIPGIKGKSIDLDKSYEEMKIGGVFREEALVYAEIFPNNSIVNNKDKYIIKGNSTKKEISILYIINSNDDINEVKNINDITLFVNSKYLTSYNIKQIKNNEIYSYGDNGVYSNNILENDNALINKLSDNKSIYCLTKKKSNNVLDICNNKDMYVVIPNIIGDYLDIKNNLSNGSIILLDSINNIDIITKYIKGKGYNIIYLSKLLEE